MVHRTNADVSSAPAPVAPERTLGNVERFRRQGYFFSDALVTPGGGHVSMALPATATGGRNIVIGVAGSATAIRRSEHEIVATMRRVVEAECPEASGETPAGARDVGDEDRAGL